MPKFLSAAILSVLLSASLAASQDDAAGAAWKAAKESGSSEEVFSFIERYPDSEFVKEAKAFMIDLLWEELETKSPDTAAGDVPTTTEEPSPVVSRVTFTAPLAEGSNDIVGKSLEELIASSPLYPPVKGLPPEAWKSKKCSNCHDWEKANLCVQANTYLTDAGSENLIKEHPFGGSFKLNLRNWADSGCG